MDTLIEVSGVDIANQKRLIELLGSDAVKIYNKAFGLLKEYM